MLELTRPLLERYLRATGFKLDVSAPTETLVRFPDGSSYHWDEDNTDSLLYNIGCALETTTEPGEMRGHLVAFRLGLCAAAEEANEMRRRWAQLAALGIDEVARVATVIACAKLRDHYLGAAGVDPKAWEAAR